MHRRTILGGLAAVAPFAPAMALGLPSAPTNAVALGSSYVVSTGERRLTRVGIGEALLLKREPERPFDRNSIAVYTSAHEKLGYLPGDQSRMLSALIDGGYGVSARVTSAVSEPRPDIRLSLELSAS